MHPFEYETPFSPHTGSYTCAHAVAHANEGFRNRVGFAHAPSTTKFTRAPLPSSPLANAQFAQHLFAYVAAPFAAHTGANASSHRFRGSRSARAFGSIARFVLARFPRVARARRDASPRARVDGR